MGSDCEIIILSRNSVGYSLYYLFLQRDYDIVSHCVAISHIRLPATHPLREDVRSLQCRSASDSLSNSFDQESTKLATRLATKIQRESDCHSGCEGAGCTSQV